MYNWKLILFKELLIDANEEKFTTAGAELFQTFTVHSLRAGLRWVLLMLQHWPIPEIGPCENRQLEFSGSLTVFLCKVHVFRQFLLKLNIDVNLVLSR